ncbi:MAG: DUF1295 domain-containing protein [Acholeplasma sp.]|nr:DUF1295 domain-containing protein [Acholeplasma sp.]
MKKYQELLLFLVIYALSMVIGLLSATFIQEKIGIELLLMDIVMTLVIYLGSLILKNASLYDPYWSVIPPFLMLYAMIKLSAYSYLNWVLWIVVFVWAIRLTYNWAINWQSFSHQDWRYDLIKQKTKKLYPLANLFGIQLMPTIVVYAQIYVAYLVIEQNAVLSISAILSALVVLLATFIQFLSDKQMKAFRSNKQNKRVIDIGLWQYSRHPNYFGEILVWWGVYGFYLSVNQTLDWLILAPMLMTMLFLGISIPMMENKILKTRPEYSDYQASTSMLIPWFKRSRQTQES